MKSKKPVKFVQIAAIPAGDNGHGVGNILSLFALSYDGIIYRGSLYNISEVHWEKIESPEEDKP